MKKTLKFLIFGSLPFILILFLILFLNIIKSDWKYAHKSMYTYQYPFDWFTYKIKAGVIKSIINLKDSENIGLVEKRIYIDEQKQNQLLTDTPKSTKVWQRGFHIDQNNNLSRVQLRFRGDNPRNWMLEKKHWRMKVRKQDIINQQRYFDYLPFIFDKYFSGKIANKINLISPKYKLVELYLNDRSQGVYIEGENLNESFLRRNKVMPVNMYKTEQILDESIIALDSNIFNSPGATSKSAIFNQAEENDKSDLEFFLELISISNEDKKKFNDLYDSIGIDNWALFNAYQILTQNFHNDNSHNIRFIVDPWSGYLIPIPYDPLIGDIKTTDYKLSHASNDLILLLNKSSKFQQLKLQKLNDILNSNIINELINNHKILEKKLVISEKRDVEVLIENFNFLNLIKIVLNKNFVDRNKNKERLIFLNEYQEYLDSINLYLKSKPKGAWKLVRDGFEISVKNDLPLSNLKIYFKENAPEAIFIDLNENNKLDEYEKDLKFKKNNDHFFIPYSFYANRLDFKNSTNYASQTTLITPNTRFKFVTSNSSKPYKIEFENIFNNNTYVLEKRNFISIPSTPINLPVNNSSETILIKKLSGINEIKETKVFNENIIIEPGTIFNLHKDKSIIFKGKVLAKGSSNNPIVFQRAKSNEHWGTVALFGKKTSGSILSNLIFDGGSGFNKSNMNIDNNNYYSIGNINYISALSLHKTNNIKLKNLIIKNNYKYDDTLHIIYSENINVENLKISNAFGDAIDIDMSQNISLKNLDIKDSTNDAVDLMESSVIIKNSKLYGSNDKAISVGENSILIVEDSELKNNNIGIATKDGSFSEINNLIFKNNNFHINNYKKNWRYGDGGFTRISNSKFNLMNRNKQKFNSSDQPILMDRYSSVIINKSYINEELINNQIISNINKNKHLKKIN